MVADRSNPAQLILGSRFDRSRAGPRQPSPQLWARHRPDASASTVSSSPMCSAEPTSARSSAASRRVHGGQYVQQRAAECTMGKPSASARPSTATGSTTAGDSVTLCSRHRGPAPCDHDKSAHPHAAPKGVNRAHAPSSRHGRSDHARYHCAAGRPGRRRVFNAPATWIGRTCLGDGRLV